MSDNLQDLMDKVMFLQSFDEIVKVSDACKARYDQLKMEAVFNLKGKLHPGLIVNFSHTDGTVSEFKVKEVRRSRVLGNFVTGRLAGEKRYLVSMVHLSLKEK